ncbi:unnamed protein product [Acanthosepion pharaonis]|uniref:Transmembrane protein n=1 Tax=Acanthosepion pharaonis TaxID=158019 RepID=A0A812F009_ACAPH|nr:unnamed protein product [Sepia pharaonis]
MFFDRTRHFTYSDGNGLARHRLLPETLISLTTATIQLQQLHRSLHSNVPTPPRSSLHTTLSSGLPPSHLSQRTPTNLHTPKFSSRQSSRLRDRVSISPTHRNGGVSFFGPITALHARHKRTLLCRELSRYHLSLLLWKKNFSHPFKCFIHLAQFFLRFHHVFLSLSFFFFLKVFFPFSVSLTLFDCLFDFLPEASTRIQQSDPVGPSRSRNTKAKCSIFLRNIL